MQHDEKLETPSDDPSRSSDSVPSRGLYARSTPEEQERARAIMAEWAKAPRRGPKRWGLIVRPGAGASTPMT